MSDAAKDRMKSVVFALALCISCSFLLTWASSGLKNRQEKNILSDKRKNILLAAGIDAMSYSHEKVASMYARNISVCWVSPDGRILNEKPDDANLLSIYLHIKDGNIKSYIIPVNTRGLWGRIMGYLALESDGSTVSGFTVYSHNETPGLGGEIEKRWFQNNFKGKRIVNRQMNFVSVEVAKGKAPDISKENFVDGISGATLTGRFLSEGLKDILKSYEPVSIKFRTDPEVIRTMMMNNREE
jgi:Na+-transporting NADH:ubiquinone oxidoreductase subunit C